MKTLSHIFSRYIGLLWAFLKPLGAWGVMVAAAIDGSFIGLPVDAVVAGYVYQKPARFLVYALMAATGSALGSIVIYLIGYKGGEELLRKRIPKHRFDKIHSTFEKHPFWGLMLPAMLPPPTPFKLFVLAAAASEMSFGKFELAIFSGRLVRFLLLGLLTLKFGPDIVRLLGAIFTRHFYVWIVIAAAAGIGWWSHRQRSKRRNRSSIQ